MNKKIGLLSSLIVGLIALLCVHAANAALIHTFAHTYGFGGDASALLGIGLGGLGFNRRKRTG